MVWSLPDLACTCTTGTGEGSIMACHGFPMFSKGFSFGAFGHGIAA